MLQVKEAEYTRLCSTKSILTVNGEFPGPTITAYKGDTVYVHVYNKGKYNITLHWYFWCSRESYNLIVTFFESPKIKFNQFYGRHGVKQPRNPWADGPEYITQCPIQPGGKFRQKLVLSTEEGTLWWHAHSDWSRATVHGAIIVYPRSNYPFPKPHAEIPIIFGNETLYSNVVWTLYLRVCTTKWWIDYILYMIVPS